jgi:hypothetical protein
VPEDGPAVEVATSLPRNVQDASDWNGRVSAGRAAGVVVPRVRVRLSTVRVWPATLVRIGTTYAGLSEGVEAGAEGVRAPGAG